MSSSKNPSPETASILQKALSDKELIIARMTLRIAALEEYVMLGKIKEFDASSEKVSGQVEMFNEPELTVVAEEILAELKQETTRLRSTPPKNTSPNLLPADLPRFRIEYDLPDAKRRCACGRELTVTSEESSEQLDISPAKTQVLVHVLKIYTCTACRGEIAAARLPAQPIPGSSASPGLLAHVAISKYQDGLPLHDQEAVLYRAGIDIPRNTLANWLVKVGTLLQPLLKLFEDQLLAYPVMHCDQTTLQALKEPDKASGSKLSMWVRLGGAPNQPIRLFHYTPGPSSSVVHELLEGYQGYLQTEGSARYNSVCANNAVTQLGCWASVRRKFTAARNEQSSVEADIAIRLIGKLYAIEKLIKTADIEARYQTRQRESAPQLDEIREWLDKSLQDTSHKGSLGKALSYLEMNWRKLTVYIEDGRLSIDNTVAENAIRPFFIGHKNYVFSASVRGATSSASIYSVIETAKANDLEPYTYLRRVLSEIPKANNVDKIEALLPWRMGLKDGVC